MKAEKNICPRKRETAAEYEEGKEAEEQRRKKDLMVYAEKGMKINDDTVA